MARRAGDTRSQLEKWCGLAANLNRISGNIFYQLIAADSAVDGVPLNTPIGKYNISTSGPSENQAEE